MSVAIGDIEIAIVGEIEETIESEVDEIKDAFKSLDNIPVKHRPSVETISITGFLNKEIHSQNLALNEQKNEVKQLRVSDVEKNSVNFMGYKGHLLVETINIDDNSDSGIIKEVEIEGRFFPWPKYYPESQP